MDINISGRKMNLGAALTEHASARLEGIADKYFSRSIDASVTFAKEGHQVRVEVSLHPNQGINLHAHAEEADAYASFDSAADKVEKQLRRYKRRLKNHHANDQAERMPYMVLAPEADEAEEAVHDIAAEDQPIIIAESHKQIPTVSVGDAVMLMDLENAGAFMFRNVKTGRLEVIYKRGDGNIGWIAPPAENALAAE